MLLRWKCEIDGIVNKSSKCYMMYLVLGVRDHGWLPLAVHIFVPVIGLLGIRIRNVLGFIPVLTQTTQSKQGWDLKKCNNIFWAAN